MEAAREATEEDVEVLAHLGRQALAELAESRGGSVFAAREARPVPMGTTLSADIADGDVTVLVGTIGGTPVGYAVGRLETLRDGRRLGVVSDLYVEPDARQVGVGEALMDELVRWFTERGCAGADATALPGDRATKNFFEESGFSARLLVMHKSLVDDMPAHVGS